jgi:zinc-binding alcohol dehydrogenase family protein
MSQVKAIQFKKGGGKAADCLELITQDKPTPRPTDLLVKNYACAVNPVDTKIRQGAFPADQITGFDAAGIIESVGSSVTTFQPGDAVYFSGVLGRPGSTAQYSLIDHRLAAKKPSNLDWVDAACMPLVTLTAWELLEEHFHLLPNDPSGVQHTKSILIINGAGGVGSIATQLARKVFRFKNVIVTASRPETIQHAKDMGATHVISHRESLKDQLQSKVGIDAVDYIFICYDTNAYMPHLIDICNPKAKIGSIVEIPELLQGMHTPDAFLKQISFHWEVMLSKGMYQYELESQGEILRRAAGLLEDGTLKGLCTEREELSVAALVRAHEKLESGKAIGKIGLSIGEDIN